MKSATIAIGQPAPDFALPGIDGRRYALADLRGRKVVLLFYRGHWCGSCRRQLGQLRDAYATIGDLGAELLALSAEPQPVAQEAAAAARLPFPILTDALAVIDRYALRHLDEPQGRQISLPCLFLLDRAGVVRFAHVGEHPRDRPAVGAILLALETIP